MNDFLSNLASRSLSMAPIIQPRPVSLFEPWRSGGALAAMSSFDRAETDRAADQAESNTATHAYLDRPHGEPREDIDAAPRTPAANRASEPEPMPRSPLISVQTVLAAAPVAAQPVQIDVPRAGAASNVTSVVERVIVDRSEAERDHIIADRPTQEQDARPAVTEPIHHSGTAYPLSHVTPGVERLERVIVEHEQADRIEIDHEARERTVPPGTEQPAIRPVLVEPERPGRVQAAQSPAIQAIGESAAPGRSGPPRLTPIIERVEGVREDPGSRRADHVDTPQPTQPTIHVTIGRIEVRATPPAAPVKRAAPPAATMTLEEYLRSRSGGKR